MITNIKLGIQTVQGIFSGFLDHVMQVIAQDFGTSTLKYPCARKSFVQQFIYPGFRYLFGGFHSGTGFSTLWGVGHSSLFACSRGRLAFDQVMTQIISRALGNEHKNSRRLSTRLPCFCQHRIFIDAPTIPNPDTDLFICIGWKLGIE